MTLVCCCQPAHTNYIVYWGEGDAWFVPFYLFQYILARIVDSILLIHQIFQSTKPHFCVKYIIFGLHENWCQISRNLNGKKFSKTLWKHKHRRCLESYSNNLFYQNVTPIQKVTDNVQ